MTSSWRLLWLSVCCAAALGTSCFGGPTSDWPKGADSNDEGDDTPVRPGGSKKDAGSASGSNLDAGLSAPDVCTPASDAGTADAGDAELERPGSWDGGIPFAAPRPAADAGDDDPWAMPQVAPYDDEDCPR